MFKVKVKKMSLTVSQKEPLVSGASQIYDVEFEFDSEWDGISSKIAVFKVKDTVIDVALGDSGTCKIPHEVLANENVGESLWIGVYGTDSEGKVLPTILNVLEVIQAGTQLGEDGSDPTKAPIQELYDVAAEARALADEARDKASGAEKYSSAAAVYANYANTAAAHTKAFSDIFYEHIRLCDRNESKTIPEGAIPYAKVTMLGGLSADKGPLASTGILNITCGNRKITIPEYILNLPDYGHGVGGGYDNIVDFEKKLYIQNCELVNLEADFDEFQSGLFYSKSSIRTLTPGKEEEEFKALSNLNSNFTAGEVFFDGISEDDYVLFISSEQFSSAEELNEYIKNADLASGDPFAVAFGRMEPIITDISDIIQDIYVDISGESEVYFNGNTYEGVETGIEFYVEKDSIAEKSYVNGTAANAVKGTLLGSAVEATDVSPLEHEISARVISKNLLDPADFRLTSNASGVEITINKDANGKNDGTITLNGTTAGDGFCALANVSSVQKRLIPGVTYRWSSNTVGSENQCRIGFVYTDEEGKEHAGYSASSTVAWKEGYQLRNIYLYIRKTDGYVFENATVSPMLEAGSEATGYVPYTSPEGAVITLTDGSETQEVTADADGIVSGLISRSPSMSLTTDRKNTVIYCEYNRDLMKVIEELTNAIISLGGNI